jgi:hypothetical protein
LNELITLFLNNLLPIFLIAGAGALLGHFFNIDPRSLSQLILYVLSPCLIFRLLTQNQLNGDLFGRVILFSLVFVAIIGAITWLIGILLRIERGNFSAMLMATLFVNAGNYGLPLVLFAFGENALSYASLFFVVNISLAYTLGTLIASMSSVNLWKAFLNLIKLPLIYAVILAFLIIKTGWEVPLPLERATKLLGDASIPCMLVLLGLQLKTANISGKILPISLAASLRLLVSPLLAIVLMPLFGLNGPASQALTLQTGMPTAVVTTMLATEYNSEPSFATAAVFISTLLSPLTLTPLLYLLGA